MKNKTYLVSALFLVFLLISAFSAPLLSGSGYETNQSDDFTLNNWAVAQDLVQPNDDVSIEGEVHNNGADGTDEEVILFINGNREDSKEIFVGAGKSKLVNFIHSEDKNGTYTVSVELANHNGEWNEGEFRVELVTDVGIEPSEDQQITAGGTIDFEAAAYSGDNDPKTDDTIFTWENTDENGLFDNTEAGEYEIAATYIDVSSTTVNVTVEPAEPAELKIVQEPSDETITAGEKARYTVQVQDGYGNEQTDGSFEVALEVEGLEPTRRHSTTIEDGESEANLEWTITSGKQGEYNLEVKADGNSLASDEANLTITEEDDFLLGGYWWSLPIVIIILVVIVISYLWTTGKFELNLGGKRKPETHEWKRNKEEANGNSD